MEAPIYLRPTTRLDPPQPRVHPVLCSYLSPHSLGTLPASGYVAAQALSRQAQAYLCAAGCRLQPASATCL